MRLTTLPTKPNRHLLCLDTPVHMTWAQSRGVKILSQSGVTDRQTDGRTDGQAALKYGYAVALFDPFFVGRRHVCDRTNKATSLSPYTSVQHIPQALVGLYIADTRPIGIHGLSRQAYIHNDRRRQNRTFQAPPNNSNTCKCARTWTMR